MYEVFKSKLNFSEKIKAVRWSITKIHITNLQDRTKSL